MPDTEQPIPPVYLKTRMEMSILFKIYCKTLRFQGQQMEFKEPLSFFNYRKWNNPETIKQACRSVAKDGRPMARNASNYCNVDVDHPNPDGTVTVTAQADEHGNFKNNLEKYVNQVASAQKLLPPGQDERTGELTRPIALLKQKDAYLDLLDNKRVTQYNPEQIMALERDMDEAPEMGDYEKCTFEELLIYLHLQGLITIKGIKLIKQPVINHQLYNFPLIVISRNYAFKYGPFIWDQKERTISFEDQEPKLMIIRSSGKLKIWGVFATALLQNPGRLVPVQDMRAMLGGSDPTNARRDFIKQFSTTRRRSRNGKPGIEVYVPDAPPGQNSIGYRLLKDPIL